MLLFLERYGSMEGAYVPGGEGRRDGKSPVGPIARGDPAFHLPRPAASHTAARDATVAHTSRPPVAAVIRPLPLALPRPTPELSAPLPPSPALAFAQPPPSSPLLLSLSPPQLPPATVSLQEGPRGGLSSSGGPKESYPAVLLLLSRRPTIYMWCCWGGRAGEGD